MSLDCFVNEENDVGLAINTQKLAFECVYALNEFHASISKTLEMSWNHNENAFNECVKFNANQVYIFGHTQAITPI